MPGDPRTWTESFTLVRILQFNSILKQSHGSGSRLKVHCILAVLTVLCYGCGECGTDRTCIDCDTCRWMAPSVFKDTQPQSAVYHQPETPEERLQALQALLACPTASIHTERPPKDIKDAHNSFPIPVDADEIPVILPLFSS